MAVGAASTAVDAVCIVCACCRTGEYAHLRWTSLAAVLAEKTLLCRPLLRVQLSCAVEEFKQLGGSDQFLVPPYDSVGHHLCASATPTCKLSQWLPAPPVQHKAVKITEAHSQAPAYTDSGAMQLHNSYRPNFSPCSTQADELQKKGEAGTCGATRV